MAEDTTETENILNEPMCVDPPTDAIGQAWLDGYYGQFTDDDLKKWLAECPRYETSLASRLRA
jgi:hypothetical protein